MASKTCFKCGEIKELNEFYKHPKMSDGHLGKCKTCAKKDTAKNYLEKRDQYAEYERHRYQNEKRKAMAVKYQKELRAKNPDKKLAWSLTWSAIRCRRLIKEPCCVCGNPRVEAHHEDYSQPLDVVWLCREHHLERHGKCAYA